MTTKPQIFLVIGCPGSGKSWVCEQLAEQFCYVRHDDHKNTNSYIAAVMHASKTETRPLLLETPFSVSQLKEPLEAHGYLVTPVFILERSKVISDRYRTREGKDIPTGHLTRQDTYKRRALEWKAFGGTSAEVLAHLKNCVGGARWPWG